MKTNEEFFASVLHFAQVVANDPHSAEWATVQWAREQVARHAGSWVTDTDTGLPTLDCLPPIDAAIVRTMADSRFMFGDGHRSR